MKPTKTALKALLLGLILTGMLLLAACSGNQAAEATDTETPATEEPTPAPVVLTVVGLDETVELTMEDLMAMDIVEGWSGTISSTGTIAPPQMIQGVRLTDLADLVGGLSEGVGLNLVAKDGYGITMSYDQTINGDFITYDPGTGDERQVDDELIPVVAFARDGEAIPADEDGPLRIFVVSEKNNQIIDGHWSVKWIERIEFRPETSDWILNLEGVITEEIDRVSFESCSAPACHGSSWTDADGNEWSGVPLFSIAGRVDDENIHEDRAFNENYAEAGYTIELFAADGYNVSIDSTDAMFSEMILLANQFNGKTLDEETFPLRLVGEGLENSQMAGQITQIILVPKAGVTPPTASSDVVDLSLPEGALLKVVGAVRNELVLNYDNLEALGMQESVAIKHPVAGIQNYTGVFLNDILSFAGLDEDAITLAIYADDGHSVELPLADVLACENCLIAFWKDGVRSMAMDGMSGRAWVDRVVALEVKTTPVTWEFDGDSITDGEESAGGETAASSVVAPEGATLEISGAAANAAVLSADDLNAIGVVDVEMEHPKNGMTAYSGILLNAILEAAEVNDDATTLVIIASDGYSAEVPLSDVLACANCLVAINEDGTFAMAMDGLASSAWVKDVIQLDLQ